jgi:hypothetical protein
MRWVTEAIIALSPGQPKSEHSGISTEPSTASAGYDLKKLRGKQTIRRRWLLL